MGWSNMFRARNMTLMVLERGPLLGRSPSFELGPPKMGSKQTGSTWEHAAEPAEDPYVKRLVPWMS